MLLDAIERVRGGGISPEQGKSIAMLAGQINLSVQVEVNARINQIKWGDEEPDAMKQLGHMPLGEDDDGRVVSEQRAVEVDPDADPSDDDEQPNEQP